MVNFKFRLAAGRFINTALKKSTEKPVIYPLDKAIKLQSFPRFPQVREYDELLVFALKTNLGRAFLLAGILSLLFFFIEASLLLLFLFNMVLFATGFIWNYRYNFRNKPLLKVNREGMTYKRRRYSWDKIQYMICAAGYNGESSTYDTTYIRFSYNNTIKTIYIDGLSRPEEEVIHYIYAFRENHKINMQG